MIQVNLLPGGRKRRSSRRSFGAPSLSLGGIPGDMWVRSAIVAGVLAVGAAGFLWLSLQSREEDAQVALDAAVADSVRFAGLIERTQGLESRRDSILDKVAIIQEIDQGRYVWAHALDEIARALPDYTWLTVVQQVATDPELQLNIEGRAGNPFALTVFMDQLAASTYFRDVRLITTEQTPEGPPGAQQIVYAFQLQATFESPPLESIETVPLIGADPLDPSGGL